MSGQGASSSPGLVRRAEVAFSGIWNVVKYLGYLAAVGSWKRFFKRVQAASPESIEEAASYSPGGLELPVGIVEDYCLSDEKRGKNLSLRISFPLSVGRHPVIVFSHGAGGSKDDYAPLSHYWSAHGYVCIHPTHGDAIPDWKKERSGWSGFMGDLRAVLNLMLSDPTEWDRRAADVKAVIDAAIAGQFVLPGYPGSLDFHRVGVTGHSYGAFTAQMLAGVKIDTGDGTHCCKDPRISAVLLFSPQGRDQFGQTAESWSEFDLPTMSVTGTRDRGTRGQKLDWIMDTFNLSPPGRQFCVIMEDASHLSFSSRLMKKFEAESAEALSEDEKSKHQEQRAIFDYMKRASLVFWDAYLKQAPGAEEYLRSESLAQLSGGKVAVLTR